MISQLLNEAHAFKQITCNLRITLIIKCLLRRWSNIVQMVYTLFVFTGCYCLYPLQLYPPITCWQTWYNTKSPRECVGQQLVLSLCNMFDFSICSYWTARQRAPTLVTSPAATPGISCLWLIPMVMPTAGQRSVLGVIWELCPAKHINPNITRHDTSRL